MPSLNMPDVGESVTEGTVTRWLKREGESVKLDEPIVEIETEKVTVEVPSPFEGRLLRILVQEGEVAPVGAPLAEFDETTDGAGAANGEGAELPQEQDQRGLAKEVREERSVAHVDGAAAVARATAAQPAQTERRGAKSDVVAPEDASADSATSSAEGLHGDGRASKTARPTDEEMRRTRRYSPVVLKLAAEHDIPLELVQGTGIEGRVTRQDIMRYMENPVAHTVPPSSDSGVVGVTEQRKAATAPAASAVAPGPSAAPARGQGEVPADEGTPPAQPAAAAELDGDELHPLSPTRRTIAKRMLDAHLTIPPAWMVVEADVSNLVILREAAKDGFQSREAVALTYMPFFVQAIVAALKEHPALNATFTDEGIRVHHRYHIGVAVAAESGLIVPVLHDADRKSIAGLAREIDALGAKARERKLGIEDVRGGTFTVDNTGAFGSIISQPLIPPGQAAIITTEAIRRELRVADDGSFSIRSVMNLCLSFDHRALDGSQVGVFMRSVKQNLETIRPDEQIH